MTDYAPFLAEKNGKNRVFCIENTQTIKKYQKELANVNAISIMPPR
tara:strand:- start:6 stop:143 length:138 start_codon:yes stop_codon:yes gene_type:complete